MIRIVLVCEGPTDPPLVCGLADRMLKDDVAWLRDQDGLDDHRSYVGLDESQRYLKWSTAPDLFQQAGLRRSRGFGRPSPDPDYVATRKLLLLIAYHHQQAMKDGGGVDGVLIFRDGDHQAEQRRQGIQNARADFVESHDPSTSSNTWRHHLAIAVAEPMNEAWIAAGFEPTSTSEHAVLSAVRQDLGFAPNASPERLRPSVAKRVLAELCPDLDRRTRCWRDTPLDTLRERGQRCGLSQFLDEVRKQLATLFQPAS